MLPSLIGAPKGLSRVPPPNGTRISRTAASGVGWSGGLGGNATEIGGTATPEPLPHTKPHRPAALPRPAHPPNAGAFYHKQKSVDLPTTCFTLHHTPKSTRRHPNALLRDQPSSPPASRQYTNPALDAASTRVYVTLTPFTMSNGFLLLSPPNGQHKPPRRLRGKPLCQHARPKARFTFAGTRRRRGRLDAMLARSYYANLLVP